MSLTVIPYVPTDEERATTLFRGTVFQLSGDGVFTTLQGEGVNAGAPSVFVRLQHCNLACGVNDGWRCDAWYTWDRSTPEFWRETENVTSAELGKRIRDAWYGSEYSGLAVPRLVITGGEPLLQQDLLADFVGDFSDWQVEIETNGTIVPRAELAAVQFNCSPKLASSGNLRRARYHPDALRTIAGFRDHWFKFVICDERDIEEVKKIADEIAVDPDRIILMSEGVDVRVLEERDALLSPRARELGYRMTKRNHIFWYGDTRRT